MARGFSTIRSSAMFQLDTSGKAREHSLKLIKCWCNKDVRTYFFSQCVDSRWNLLDDVRENAKMVNSFRQDWTDKRSKMAIFLD